MWQHIFLLASVCSLATLYVSAIPLPANDRELDMLQIPLTNGKEIDVLTLSSKDQEQAIAERNKRTIGLLRELFPDITKQVDEQTNRVISKILRAVGPTLLRTAIQGNTANRARSNFDVDFDDDDEDGDSSANSGGSTNSGGSSNSGGTRVSIELPTFSPDDSDDDANEIDSADKSTTASTTTTASA